MRTLLLTTALLCAACGDSLISRSDLAGGGSNPECAQTIDACGPTCSACPAAPANASEQCIANACTYTCATPYLKCDGGCCLATAIAAGGDTTCAVVQGAVRCWGSNAHGLLGSAASAVSSSTPVQIAGISNASAVAVGGSHACALSASGTFCWGANDAGQLGTAPGADSAAPVRVAVTGATSIATGARHSCAGTASNVFCWGANESGQVGVAPSTSETPQDVPGFVGAQSVAAGTDHSCAVTSSGAVFCWGSNSTGQLGRTSTDPSPAQVANLSQARAVVAGNQFGCALLQGDVDCWGVGTSGQLGDGKISASSNVPVKINNVSNPKAVGVGTAHGCVALTNGPGALSCWGRNDELQTGTGPNNTPVGAPQPTGLTNVAQIAAGTLHSCALLATGAVVCWGANNLGQLGSATAGGQNPAEVTGN
jgi:alpha-tubulin suppressor-like RCC1 family protein